MATEKCTIISEISEFPIGKAENKFDSFKPLDQTSTTAHTMSCISCSNKTQIINYTTLQIYSKKTHFSL